MLGKELAWLLNKRMYEWTFEDAQKCIEINVNLGVYRVLFLRIGDRYVEMELDLDEWLDVR